MKKNRPAFLILVLFLVLQGCSPNESSDTEMVVHPVEFNSVDTSEPDSLRTLSSLKREGDLFMITYYGNYAAWIEELNNRIILYGISSVIPGGSSQPECSIYSALGDPARPLFGRNLDNYTRRSVLIGYYSPPGGYASIALTSMSDMGFGPNNDPTLLPIESRLLLLNSPLFPADGINERGVSVALASVPAATIVRDESKDLVCISYLQRKILDQAATLDEALAIVSDHDAFDQNNQTISHHLLIADASGRSAVTEYVDGQWRILMNDQPWQIATNSRLYNRTEQSVRNICWRYRRADNYLGNANGVVTWQEGMTLLDSMSQNTTQWSAVYDLVGREISIALHRNYSDIMRVGFP
jgi:hypothetical protein